ncbi:ABC transporter ATP-binding protein [Cohnella sp. GCM10012308]|uniref:ABC transporter ATP-binding protein n=1 Tax=Cohnella sp. GCM10012308 TaxID=3317329 RepID=UPI00360D0641
MGINYARYRAALERQYTDRATVERQHEVVKPNKATVTEPIVAYADQPCRISQTGLPRDGQTEAQNDVDYLAKLFIAPDLEVLQGDTITVQRGQAVAGTWTPLGDARTYRAGEPFIYPTHQEISLHRKDYA